MSVFFFFWVVKSYSHYSIRKGKKNQQRNRRYKWQAAKWIYREGKKMRRGNEEEKKRKSTLCYLSFDSDE